MPISMVLSLSDYGRGVIQRGSPSLALIYNKIFEHTDIEFLKSDCITTF